MSRKKLRVVSTLPEFPAWLEQTMQREGFVVREVSGILGVTPKTVYEWLRGKGPLHPSHVKAQLIQKIEELRHGEAKSFETLHKQTKRPGLEVLVRDVSRRRLAGLPPSYRERYQRRVNELAVRVGRELEEFLRLLEAEYQAKRGKR